MSTVDEVKQRTDIVDLVSGYVTLKRTGRTFMALCPFHNEKTPSFHVDPARQTWHCFGACGTGGDVFGFVMKKHDCDFREALRMLAERAGVALDTRRDGREDARRTRLFEVNEAAAAYFHSALLESPAAAVARDYIAGRRMSDESVERFQLGYAPNAWESLAHHLESRDFSNADAIAAGLLIEGDRGMHDRFRHRLMFPIRDERGRVAGFGGRVLPGDAVGGGAQQQAKYVNTPQSPIFDKGAILYGLHVAREAIRNDGQAVIVEGYMDAIAAHEHGFTNVVASMGTALTERQVALIKRFTRNVVLALDADAAGSEATIRGVHVVTDAMPREAVPQVNWRGVVRFQETLAADIRVLNMPEGRDPDDVIRTSPDLWSQLVRDAKPVLDHLFDGAGDRHDLDAPRGRSAAAAELLPLVAAISDRVVQSHYLQRLARMTRTDEATLRLDMRPARATSRNAQDAPLQTHAGPPPTVRDRREEFCLALLFRYPELRAEGSALDAALFGQSENRALFEAWLDCADGGEPLERSLAPDLRPHFERVVKLDLPSYDDDALVRALRSTVWGIEQQRLRLAKRASTAMLADIAEENTTIAERARQEWHARTATTYDDTDDQADPAAAFVQDMEAGRKVHQRLLEQRNAERPAR